MSNPLWRMVWYGCALLLAAVTYCYGLDSQYIPKNGDEYPYEHITRLTAASGELLPLQSQLDHMRNTKPPLLFWQGIASTHHGADWTLWNLRYPSVIYTLLTAALLVLLGARLATLETGLLAALTFLAFFSTYRFGRPFLTNPPEVFYLFLPFFALLYWPRGLESRVILPLLVGLSVGLAFAYKSFALGLPVTLGLCAWYLHQQQYSYREFLRQDAAKVGLALAVAIFIFALWFVFDPNPTAVWNEFIIGENAGKFDPHGNSYLGQFWWGDSSVWNYTAAFLTNAGLLSPIVIALFFVALPQRRSMSREQKLLWLWVAALFFSFCLPSQRSGRYLLAAMPVLALLAALNWQALRRWVFIVALLLCSTMLLLLAWLALRLQHETVGLVAYAPTFWLLLAGASLLSLVAIILPDFTRHATPVVAILVLLSFAALLRPLDNGLAIYDLAAQRATHGKTVAVPCNFRAHDEGYRFLLHGANVVGYHENLHLDVAQLAQYYDVFAVQQSLQTPINHNGCADCRILAQRLDIRGRQSSEELRDMFLRGHLFEHLFVREVLIAAPTQAKLPAHFSAAEQCR